MTALASPPRSKLLHYGVWAVQVLLALPFLAAGIFKATTPLDQLALQMPWVSAVPGALVRFIGAAELAGALGLILPAATRIRPILTPVAAIGLTTVMVLAAALHVSRGEMSALPINAVLGSLAAFVAWARLRKAPIAAR